MLAIANLVLFKHSYHIYCYYQHKGLASVSTSSDSFSSEEHKDDIKQPEEHSLLPSEPSEPAEPAEPSEPSEPAQSPLETPPPGAVPTAAEALPPEAQGEANGGPLGCCLGIMIGLLLSLSVAIFSRFYADPLASVLHNNLSVIVRVVMVIVAIIAVIICGYFGWKIGKIFYREYDDPRLRQKRRKRKRSAPNIS
jgi:hypothetical protein